MIEILENKAGKEIAGEIKDSVHKISQARASLYRQCLVNVMFLYGKQHFILSRNNDNSSVGERVVWEIEAAKKKSAIRRTSNYILPLFRAIYSRLIRQKGTVYSEPTTHVQTDREAARVAKEVSEDFWDYCNKNNIWTSMDYTGMQSILMKLDLYMMTTGVGYLFPYFNPKAATFVYDSMRNDVIESDVGEAEVRVDNIFNVYKDPFNRFVIHRRFLCPDQIDYEFDQEVAPSVRDEESIDVKVSRMLDGYEQERLEKDGAYIYTKYCVPTKKEPNGRIYVCTENDIIYDSELPQECKRKIPCYEFKYQDLGFSANAQGAIEQVVDLQQDYNFTLSRIAQHKKLLTGKVLVPKKSGLSTKYNDVVGQLLFYNQGFKPTMEAAPPIPDYYFKEIARIREDMENLMNSHDVSMGRTPGQIDSGIGIQNLAERDDAMIAPELIMFELKLGFFMEHILDICQFRYQERRLLRISGEDMAYQVKSFIGSDLMGHKRIKVKMGSNFPLGKTDKMNYILMLRKEGFISPEKAKELMEFNDVDGAFHNIDEQGAKQDILNILEGTSQVIPEPFEDHTIYLKVIHDFMKGQVYQRLPMEKREAIKIFEQIHQEMLLMEQQAAARMGGPLPPPAQPQMERQE